MSVKRIVSQQVQSIPDKLTIKEFLYELELRFKSIEAINEISEERIISHEMVMDKFYR